MVEENFVFGTFRFSLINLSWNFETWLLQMVYNCTILTEFILAFLNEKQHKGKISV